MANTLLYLNDGTMVILFDDNDFVRLIYERLGREAEQKLLSLINNANEAKHYAEMKYNSDMNSYELSLENNTAAFQEILEIIEQIRNTPRLEKTRLHKFLNEIEKLISNQI